MAQQKPLRKLAPAPDRRASRRPLPLHRGLKSSSSLPGRPVVPEARLCPGESRGLLWAVLGVRLPCGFCGPEFGGLSLRDWP